MSLKTSQQISAILLASILCFHATDSFGSGFAVYTQDASALGQGNAMIAHTDGPAAVFFNPALLNKLEGTQVEVGTTLISPSRKFKSDFSGKEYETEYSVFYPSTFYISHRFDDKVSAGLGVRTCLPYASALIALHRLESRPLVEPVIQRKFFTFTRRDRTLSPAALRFEAYLNDYVARQGWV
mgnify:CR=1 FL=1